MCVNVGPRIAWIYLLNGERTVVKTKSIGIAYKFLSEFISLIKINDVHAFFLRHANPCNHSLNPLGLSESTILSFSFFFFFFSVLTDIVINWLLSSSIELRLILFADKFIYYLIIVVIFMDRVCTIIINIIVTIAHNCGLYYGGCFLF